MRALQSEFGPIVSELLGKLAYLDKNFEFSVVQERQIKLKRYPSDRALMKSCSERIGTGRVKFHVFWNCFSTVLMGFRNI